MGRGRSNFDDSLHMPRRRARLRRFVPQTVAGLLLASGCSSPTETQPNDGGSSASGADSFASRVDASGARTDGDGGAAGNTALDAAGAPAQDSAVGSLADADVIDAAVAQDGWGTTLVDGPGAEAFDTRTGRLNVDYGGYISKHDIVFNKPNTNPLYGLTVGNGRTGAMVWSANGLTMQLSGVDTSEQTAFSAGTVNFRTAPAMDSGYSTFQQRLSLYDGSLSTHYDANRTVTIMGAPNSELMGIHVEDSRTNVSAATIDLGIWDVSGIGNNGAVPNLATWQTVGTFADATGIGLSRGQSDPNDFGYTLAATVDGATFTSQTVDARTVRLNIAPAPSYTIWIACATRLNALNHDSVTQARKLLGAVASTGYASTLSTYQAWWHALWAKSFVQYSNARGDADYLENFYYLATYIITSGAYGTYPFHFINGVYRATGDSTKWSNAYWYWNQRDVYHSFLTSNHADVMRVFNDMYSRASGAMQSFTMAHFGVPGLWVPETMGWNGNADGTVGSDYTKNIYSTGTEAAENMYAQYQYTGDTNYLSQTAYPFMKAVANFYANKLSYNSGTGKYFVASSNAHETYWNVQDAITDLAAVRTLFPITIQTAQMLGLDGPLTVQLQKIVDSLAPYPNDGTNYLPHDPPIAQNRNNENVACELIWPYSVTGIGAPDYAMALNTWNHRPFPYGNVWANDAIQAARLGLGDQANQGMKIMLQKYQNYPNGFTNNTNGVFEYMGVHLSATNESLLQSHDGKIRAFPAIPTDATFVGRFTLLAKGGFLVTSEMEKGEVKYLGIKSLLGSAATVFNPWGAQALQVRRAGDSAVLVTSSGAEFNFPTTSGAVYIVERAAKPLASYAYAYVTGVMNQSTKVLSSSCSLGM
jgi:alpha-L-fucosidase 2